MKPLTLMLACNDEHGIESRLEQIEIDGGGAMLLRLEHAAGAPPTVRFGKDRVRLGKRVFPFLAHGSMVGNVFWDSITVTASVAADILTWASELQTESDDPDYRFEPSEGVDPLFDLAETHQAITADDLARAVGA